MNPHDIYLGALLTVVESILSGATTVNTMHHYTPEENEAKAFEHAHLARPVQREMCEASAWLGVLVAILIN